jgi:hypothetical protein
MQETQTTKERIRNLLFFNKFFFLTGKLRKNCFGLISFSTAQTEKNSRKKLGETRFVFGGLIP